MKMSYYWSFGFLNEKDNTMLTLPIKKQWFDEILAGTKKIEYREIKPYWTSRLLKVTGIDGDPDESVSVLAR